LAKEGGRNRNSGSLASLVLEIIRRSDNLGKVATLARGGDFEKNVLAVFDDYIHFSVAIVNFGYRITNSGKLILDRRSKGLLHPIID